jgi:N-ethylmaleimide reductase
MTAPDASPAGNPTPVDAVPLLTPFQLGSLMLPNRLVMAPMTRSRAGQPGNVPSALTATYYAQRASAGLIITEGAPVSPQGVGYYYTPGIHSAEQIAGWQAVTTAVHRAGGRIFLQLWHVGRISHPALLNGELPVGPSAIAGEAHVYTPEGLMPVPVPRELTVDDLTDLIGQFRQAAMNAKAAGFDGVELHGANGYLLDQFLRDGSNRRTDAYGGSVANRARLPLAIVDAVSEVWGPQRVGYQVSPAFQHFSMTDSQPLGTFGYLADALGERKLGYLHISAYLADPAATFAAALRRRFQGTVIVNGGYDRETGNQAIENGAADLIAYGTPFIANPDLPERFRQQAPLNEADPQTFHGGGSEGYTDYPALVEP